MIFRDSYGLIVQPDYNWESYWAFTDAGDSASRTGIMALCGSEQDIFLLPKFCIPKFIRHPYDEKWSDPNLMSRDQLICLMAGFGDQSNADIPYFKYEFWMMNKDILTPSHWGHLNRCAGIPISWLFRQISDINLLADIFWSTKIRPWSEQNQIICMCLVRGKWWVELYKKWHPDYRKALTDYWAIDWRRQGEIAELLIAKLDAATGPV